MSEPAFDPSAVARRVAENDARFRQANENIARVAEETGAKDRIPLLCECANMSCNEIVRLSLAEYEEIRSSGRTFFNAPGHVTAGQGWARVTEERDGYDVVEKVGEAAEIAEDLDPRS